MFRKIWLLIFSISFLFSFQKDIGKRYHRQQISKIESLIEKGNHPGAIDLADNLLKKRLDQKEKYTVLSLKSKAFYFSEDLYGFSKASEVVYRLNKDKGEIFKAYYYAEKAAFWHFNMVGDKATYFSDEAMRILKKNWRDRNKIPYHFIYQMYGTTFLYRRGLTSSSSINTDIGRKVHLNPIMNYLDSSLAILKTYKHFSCEESLIHRSKGSRKLDMLNYILKTKAEQKKFTPYQHQLFQELIQHYNRALKSTNTSDINLKINIYSLKTLAYYCYGDKENGDLVFNTCYKLYKDKANRSNENKPLHQILSLIKYKISNEVINNVPPNSLKKFYRDISQLTTSWDVYIASQKEIAYDSYNISPYISLAILDEYFYQKTKQNKYIRRLTKNVINSFMYYAKCNSNQIDMVRQIQNRLNPDEAFILYMNYNLIKEKKNILILKDRIIVSTFNHSKQQGQIDISEKKLADFKRKAYDKYIHYFKKLEPELEGIKKIYLSMDARQEFPSMISDTIGTTFKSLNYLSKRFNFVFVYNPIDFFAEQKNYFPSQLTFFSIKETKSRSLPFMNQMMHIVIKKWKGRIEESTQKLYSLFDKNGILNIVGHGTISIFKPTKTLQNEILMNNKNFVQSSTEIRNCKQDLIVLNNCYAGVFEFYTYSNNYLQLNLLKKGAKAVIASRYATVDESSAEIMECFYKKLKAGFSVEDALYIAKQNYFKSHTGEQAHPIYWAGLQLTSNVKDLRIATEPIPDKSWQAYLVLLVLIAIVLWFYLYWVEN